MGEPLARVWDRTHRRNKRRTEGTERRGQRGPRPLQHGSLTYPQFTSDYYALYTYAAFLSRLSLSLSLSLLFSSLLSSSPSFSLDPDESFLSLWLFVVLRPSRAVSLDAALYGNRGRYRFTTVPSR